MVVKALARVAAVVAVTLLGAFAAAALAGRIVERRLGRACLTELCNRMAWVEEHRARPVRESGGGSRFDPLLGWTSEPNQRPDPRLDSRITTDSLGARGLREIPLERTAAKRVVALGDSFTFGACVDDEQSWPARLEHRLPGVEVVNRAVQGYGLDQMVLAFERDGVRYRPDVVVLAFIRADLQRCTSSFESYAKPRFELDGDEGLRLVGVPVPAPCELFDREASPWRRLLRDAERGLHLDERAQRALGPAREDELARRLIARFASAARAAGAQPVVVYLPIASEVLGPARRGRSPFFAPMCERSGARCLNLADDVADFVAREPSPDHFKCHYGARLQDHVAASIAAAIAPLLAR